MLCRTAHQTLLANSMSSLADNGSWSSVAATGSEEEGYRITHEFVTAMLEEFRQQRKIHIRFAFQIVMDVLAQLQTLSTLIDVTIPDGASFTVCGVRRLCAPPTYHLSVHSQWSLVFQHRKHVTSSINYVGSVGRTSTDSIMTCCTYLTSTGYLQKTTLTCSTVSSRATSPLSHVWLPA